MINEKAICPVCGKEFVKKQRNSRCCSHECNQKLYRMEHREVYKKICPICGCEFETTNSIVKYCGKVCACKSSSIRSGKYAKHASHEPRACVECGGEFIPKSKASRFCCKDCYKAYYARLQIRPFKAKICEICGKEFIPNSVSAKYCCDECRKEAQKKAHKKGSYQYKRDADMETSEPQKKGTPKSPASRRWAKMSWDEVLRENDYYGLRYRDSQIMAEKGTLPEDYGLKKKRKVG